MRRCVLLVAAELDLRARFARELQSSGYAVELASDMKRALRLSADHHFRVAIVAPGPSPASLSMIQALRDIVPKMIMVAEGLDEIARLRLSLPGVDEFIFKSADEGALAARVSEMIALADSAAGERVLCSEHRVPRGQQARLSGSCFRRPRRSRGGSHPRRVRLAERTSTQSVPSLIARQVAAVRVVARIPSIAAWICLSRECGARSSRMQRFPDSS